MTSQFFANVYLNELDYFVKHKIKAKYYIRYVDDFVILDASKERLEFCKTEINAFLRTIKLELHPEKSKIIPLHRGINLLGFRVFYHYKLPKKSNLRLVQNRIDYFMELYRDAIIAKEEILMRMEGWNAYAIHGNTFNLRRRMSRRLKKSLA
ncbi:MAG: RNA-directed DNA polymerase [Candidatus Aenigmatarchaeota archaeon]